MMLYQLGALTMQVQPFNVHEISREAGADFAAKDVMGAMRPREFMGEGDEAITLTGRLFPEKFGGLGGLSALDQMRRSGVPQILMRGDGAVLGWFLIEKITEKGEHLDAQGVGRMIEVAIGLVRAPGPAAAGAYVSVLSRLVGGAPALTASISGSLSIGPGGISASVSASVNIGG